MSSISVVIPARDDAIFLRTCLHALSRQTRAPDEIIVVDNGSSDDTAEVARAAGARVVFEPEIGILRASAAGFDAAQGEIIARLDADSVPPTDWVERVESMLGEASAPAIVTGPGDFYGAGTVTRWLGRVVYIGGYFWAVGRLLGHPPIFGSNFAMHREVWASVRSRVHRTVRRVHDDLDLAIQLEPGITIVCDHTLRVGISARPFQTLGGLARRVKWAYLTLAISWREEALRVRRRRWKDSRRNDG